MGFRTPAGRITTTQSFKTIQIPRLVRGKPNAWDPQICLRWGEEFLASLRARMSEQASSAQTAPTPTSSPCVWRVTLTPGLGVSIYPLDDEGIKEVQGGENRVGFLPPWYIST